MTSSSSSNSNKAVRRRRQRRANSRHYWLLLSTAGGSLCAATAASCSSSSRSRHVASSQRDPPRGGGASSATTSTTAEDEELDAYIENLIASVDDSTSEAEEEPLLSSFPGDNNDVGDESEDESKDLEEDDESEEVEGESEERDEEESEEEIIEEEEEEDESEEDEAEDAADDESDQESDQDESESELPVSENALELQQDAGGEEPSQTSEVEDDKVPVETANESVVLKATDKETEPDQVTATDEATNKSSQKETAVRPPPPSPIFLFLLRRGTIGHVLAMSLVLTVEFIQTYLPTLAKFLAWMWSCIAPERLQRGSTLPRRRRRPDPPTVAINPRRTTGSSKLRKKLTLQADEQALEQLKRVGDIKQAKYCHVSTDFLQRHGLGQYADSVDSQQAMVEASSVATLKHQQEESQEEVDDDVDWVVEALAKDKKRKTKKSSVRPTVSMEVGPKGPSMSVGVEFGFGGNKDGRERRTSLAKAATASGTSRKKRKLQRASDRDGGSGVVGRLRAAAGANSRVSRSLFGAYPGDALPLDEAASSNGVIELAERYGYGEWSEEDEDGDQGGDVRTHHRSKSRRRKKRHHSNAPEDTTSWRSSSDSIVADWEPPATSTHGTRRRKEHTSRRTERKSSVSTFNSPPRSRRIRSDPPLSSSSVLGKTSGFYSADRLEKANTVRPAMDRVNEVRRKARTRIQNQDEE